MSTNLILGPSQCSQIYDNLDPALDFGSLNNGMVLGFDFGEESGDIIDQVGGSNLQRVNNPTSIAGHIGQATRCFASGNHGLIRTHAEGLDAFNFGTNDFTIAMWVRAHGSQTTNRVYLHNGATNNSIAGYNFAGFFSDRSVSFRVCEGVTQSQINTGDLWEWDTWHLFVWACEKLILPVEDQLYLNFDNTEEMNDPVPNTPELPYDNVDPNTELRVGMNQGGGGYDLDYNLIVGWNRLLTTPEVDAIWNGGAVRNVFQLRTWIP